MFKAEAPEVVIVPLNGFISASEIKKTAEGINPEKFARTFKSIDKSALKLIILDINSGGGSPVGSSMIHDSILKLKEDLNCTIVAHCRDVCASGAYMIASACDKIYAHRSSLIGSIGVIMSNFGFDRFIDNHKIEYREFTAGENKGFVSPFKPLEPKDEMLVQALLEDCHEEFVEMVYNARSNKKMEKNKEEIVSAKVFSGKQAMKKGLVDDFKNPDQIIDHHVANPKPKIATVRFKEGLLKRLFSISINVKFDDLMQLKSLVRF